MLGQVLSDTVEEVVVVNSLVTSDEVLLSGLLNFSEVLPVVKVASVFNREPLESFISAHFVERSVLDGALGDCCTHLLDISNCPFQLHACPQKSFDRCEVLNRISE